MIVLSLITWVAVMTTAEGAGKNLTGVSWEHAVNSAKLLNDTLKSKVKMIEADVSLSTSNVPIMAHPPNKTSDLTLEQFLGNVSAHNNKTKKEDWKGVKLDFKAVEAFKQSTAILKKFPTNYTLWLNADVVKGPGDPKTVAVDPSQFIAGCSEFPNATISLGWTTDYNNKTQNKTYEKSHVVEMEKLLKDVKNINATFAIRAVYAVNNKTAFDSLINKKSNRTLTIWSGVNDTVDPKKLMEFIKHVGSDKAYLDVPKNLSDHMSGGTAGIAVNLLVLLAAALFTYVL